MATGKGLPASMYFACWMLPCLPGIIISVTRVRSTTMMRYVPTLIQPDSRSRVTTEQPVPMKRPPSFWFQSGAGKASTFTSAPDRMFSSTGPSSTRTGSNSGAIACHCAGLPRMRPTKPRCEDSKPRRRIAESRVGLLVLHVRTRCPFGYPTISSNSKAGGLSRLTISWLMAPISRWESAPNTSRISPSVRISSIHWRRSRELAALLCSMVCPLF